ncbi:MAG: peptidoglycan DD-metalloendopeptidase family protein [Gammaproteobacteria bacterium AqS3]|nr:peptidoglycan DD-metalloendopeptidase family protein [Gammaproteobacteria bacterium AqS3]
MPVHRRRPLARGSPLGLCALAAAWLLLCPAPPVGAQAAADACERAPESDACRQLEQLQQAEQRERLRIQSSNRSIKSRQRELRSIERQISGLNSTISRLQKTEADLKNLQSISDARIAQLEEQLHQQQSHVNRMLRRHYRLVQSGALSPAASGAAEALLLPHYLGYWLRAPQSESRHYRAIADSLHQARRIAEERARRVAQNAAESRRQREALAQASSQRSQLITNLQGRVAQSQRELDRIGERRRELEALVRELERQALASQRAGGGKFPSLRGKLLRPVRAVEVLARYGARSAAGQRSDGIRLRAVPGAPVRAVAEGEVVYSGALKAVGNFIVIDHGGGYSSVYGEVDPVIAQGAKVRAGENIARVRDAQPEMFFALRQRSGWFNPEGWLAGSW